MSNLKSYFFVIGIVCVVLMPLWIIGVSNATWSSSIRRIVICLMALSSFAFGLFVISKPNTDIATTILGDAVSFIYMIIVMIVTYRSLRKLK